MQDEERIPLKQALRRLDAHAKAEEQTAFKLLLDKEASWEVDLELYQ